MSFRSWVRQLFARPRLTRRVPIRRWSPGRLPCLEVLESRLLPSSTSIVVNSVLDNVNDAVVTGPTVTLREAINYSYNHGTGDPLNPFTITFAPSVAGKTIT